MAAHFQWQLDNDPTRLSYVEARISSSIPNLLAIPAGNTPVHLHLGSLQRFRRLYGWLGLRCRISSCRQSVKLYKSNEERQDHEKTHSQTYTCVDCGAVLRGFKSASALRKHRETYHMELDDFEIPQSLVFPPSKL